MGEPNPVRSLTSLGRAFRESTEELAKELCDACRPLLPPAQSRMLRPGHLGVVAGVEWERPIVASVMSLAPAVTAAGDIIYVASLRGGDRTHRALAAAEPVAELADEALRALPTLLRSHAGVVEFAHRLALATHLSSGPVAEQAAAHDLHGWGRHHVRPSLWPSLSEALRRRVDQAREVARHGGDAAEAEWSGRIHAAAACRDAAAHAMRAHAMEGRRGGSRTAARMHRSLAFASLYCGFATLRELPRPAARSAAKRRGAQGAEWGSSGGRAASIWSRLRSITRTTSSTAAAERRRAA